MNAATESGVLADTLVEEYRDRGYVVVDAVYSPAEIARMRAALDELVGAGRRLGTGSTRQSR